MNRRADLQRLTQRAFSASAYRSIDDEWQVVGKYCRCTYLGNDHWDVWLCNPKDMVSGLSQRKVRAISARIAATELRNGGFRELTGEGVYDAMPTATLLKSARYLGIKGRRAPSPAQLEALSRARRAAA